MARVESIGAARLLHDLRDEALQFTEILFQRKRLGNSY
jgi:hypothetical protein